MTESKYIHKSHNVSLLIYHVVTPAKYRRVIFDDKKVEEELKKICKEIEKRYEINFLEIGVDNDHAHFLVQSVPMYSPKKIVQTIKSLTAREEFEKFPKSKKGIMGNGILE